MEIGERWFNRPERHLLSFSYCSNRKYRIFISDEWHRSQDRYFFEKFYDRVVQTLDTYPWIILSPMLLSKILFFQYRRYNYRHFFSSSTHLLIYDLFLSSYALHSNLFHPIIHSFIFFKVNGGRSFSKETSLQVNAGSLYALSMYDTLIGVAFDNTGEKLLVSSCLVCLTLSNTMSYARIR